MTDVYRYINKFNYEITIGEYTILPKGEVRSNEPIDILDQYDGVSIDRYLNGVPFKYEFNPYHIVARDSIVLPSEAGKGIKVNTSNPSYQWVDLIGNIMVNPGPVSNKPDFTTYTNGIKQFQFLVDNEVFLEFHMHHDYVPGTDMYIHTHWSHSNPTVPSGVITWGFELLYAKGYSRQSFNATASVVTVSASLAVPQYQHEISEIPFTNGDGSGGLINRNNLEPDGIFLVRCYLQSNTGTVAPFLHFCDMHYQSTGIGTVNRNYNFYN